MGSLPPRYVIPPADLSEPSGAGVHDIAGAKISEPPGLADSYHLTDTYKWEALLQAMHWERGPGSYAFAHGGANCKDAGLVSTGYGGQSSPFSTDVFGSGSDHGFSLMSDAHSSMKAKEHRASLERTLVEVLRLASNDSAIEPPQLAGGPQAMQCGQMKW